LGRWRWPASIGLGAYIGITCVIPLLGLVLMSGVKALTTLEAPWHLFTAENWRLVATDPTLRRSITNSLLIAGGGGAATVLLVAAATLIAHRSGFGLRRILAPALIYPRAVPGVILGIGFFWTYLMFTPGALVRNNLWGELIALCVRNLTLAYVVIYPSLARINAEFDRAARSSGAGWWTVARRILLPILRPALLAAFVLMFITLLGDYDPVVFLQKPGTGESSARLPPWPSFKSSSSPSCSCSGPGSFGGCAVPDIRVEHLTKSLSGTRVLDDVSFTVKDKEFVTLLGPSGCGKTTTLLSIAGLQTPDEGLITCGDETFVDLGAGVDLAAERRNLGIVFQSYAIWPHMTVAQNVAFPLRVRKMPKRAVTARVKEVLALVELSEQADR